MQITKKIRNEALVFPCLHWTHKKRVQSFPHQKGSTSCPKENFDTHQQTHQNILCNSIQAGLEGLRAKPKCSADALSDLHTLPDAFTGTLTPWVTIWHLFIILVFLTFVSLPFLATGRKEKQFSFYTCQVDLALPGECMKNKMTCSSLIVLHPSQHRADSQNILFLPTLGC